MAALSYPPNVIREVVGQLDIDEDLVALCDFRLPRHNMSRTIALTTSALRLFEFARFGPSLRRVDASVIPLKSIRDVRVSNDRLGLLLSSIKVELRMRDRSRLLLEANYAEATSFAEALMQLVRADREPAATTRDRVPASPADVPEAPRPQDASDPDLAALLAQLDALVGLRQVKASIQELAQLLKVMAMRREQGLPIPSFSHHLGFVGNPGTGKQRWRG